MEARDTQIFRHELLPKYAPPLSPAAFIPLMCVVRLCQSVYLRWYFRLPEISGKLHIFTMLSIMRLCVSLSACTYKGSHMLNKTAYSRRTCSGAAPCHTLAVFARLPCGPQGGHTGQQKHPTC